MQRCRLPLFLACLILVSVMPSAGQDRATPSKLSPAMERLLEEDAGPYRVWVFFTDKGLPNRAAREEAIARVAASYNPRATERRRLRGRNAIHGEPLFDFLDLPVHERYVGEIDATGAQVRIRSRWVNAVSAVATREQIDAIAALPAVAKVQPVARSRRPGFIDAPSPAGSAGTAAALDLDYGRSTDQLTQINLIALHEAGYTGEGVLVGILDTGFRRDHVAFNQPGHEIEIVAEYDFVDDDPDTSNEPGDPPSQHDHGTMILGTLASYHPGELVGGAYDATYALAKTEDTTDEYPAEEDNYVAGLEFLEAQGVDMTTSSLGYIDWYTQEDLDGETAVTTVAMNAMNDRGVHSATAAGNEYHDSDPTTSSLIAPADAYLVLTVGAVTSSGSTSSFSSDGPTADGRVKPELLARGSSTSTVSPSSTTGFTTANGTSLSTPLVAGALACLIQANPHWTVEVMREELFKNADFDPGGFGFDPTYVRGYGIVDAQATHENAYKPDGIVFFRDDFYSCNGTLDIALRDDNIPGDPPTVDIELWSTTEADPETVTLTQVAPGLGRYQATFPTTDASPMNGDGALSVMHDDVLTASYVDADDGEGGTGVIKTDTALADCVAPVISAVQETGVTDVAATITWTTNEDSTSAVHWGQSTPPDQVTEVSELTNSHSVDLTGLQQCTVYYYSAESADHPGNVALDDNNGAYFHFETLADFGDGLQPCHEGRVTLEADAVSCSSSLPIKLVDLDLNWEADVIDTATVTVTSSTEIEPEVVTLTETGPNTSTFTGSIATAPGPAIPDDGILQVTESDLLTATYQDDDDGTGHTSTHFDTSNADCVGAGHPLITVTGITDESATINWTTGEATRGYVDWGTTQTLGTQTSLTSLQTSHSATIGLLPECGRIYFRIHSTDAYGNDSAADAGGTPFEFNANEIPGAVFKDGFETGTGWSLDGEWEIDAPQGLGTSPGDPGSSYSGTKLLGHDLTGQGDWSGDYEQGSEETAISPPIDASALSNGQLKFRRWLNVGSGGIAYLQVETPHGWQSIWNSSSSGGHTESSWSLQTYDVSEYADGNSSFRVRFLQKSGIQQSHDAGWNIDRFIVRDGSLPDYDACGGCGGAPSFAGVATATDDDPCAGSGVFLSWSQAPAWGSGHAGTYAVYRDTTPGFTPSGANLVASGIAGTGWTDSGAPNDVDLYYVVRAENDETCSTGPNNGGVQDGNLVYGTVRDETSQPLPGDVGNTVLVDDVNDAHVRLTWLATPNAADYHIYRSDSPDGTYDRIGEAPSTMYEDEDQIGDSQSRYYLIRAADACGNEGP